LIHHLKQPAGIKDNQAHQFLFTSKDHIVQGNDSIMSIISAFWHYKLGLETDILVRTDAISANFLILSKTALNQWRDTNVMIRRKVDT